MTWEIFVGIAALVSFMIAVITPMLKLNNTITKANDHLESLQSALNDFKTSNEKSHKRIWDHNDEQDKKLEELDNRVDKHDIKLAGIETWISSADKKNN
jgi:cell division protein FtsL